MCYVTGGRRAQAAAQVAPPLPRLLPAEVCWAPAIPWTQRLGSPLNLATLARTGCGLAGKVAQGAAAWRPRCGNLPIWHVFDWHAPLMQWVCRRGTSWCWPHALGVHAPAGVGATAWRPKLEASPRNPRRACVRTRCCPSGCLCQQTPEAPAVMMLDTMLESRWPPAAHAPATDGMLLRAVILSSCSAFRGHALVGACPSKAEQLGGMTWSSMPSVAGA